MKNFLPSLNGIIVTAIIFVILSIAAPNASAATYIVTRSDDRNQACLSNADCSLREAVGAANATTNADVIKFAAGLTLITLASGDAGDIVIANNGSLAIIGPGANVLTIDGGAGINRIFYTDQATVSIWGVTMQGGNGGGAFDTGFGGAICAKQGKLALDSVVVRNNGGDSVAGGGVMLRNSADASIINSTFSGNASVQCGAIYNISGTAAVINTTISGNSAAFNGNAGGGFCNSGGMSVRNSTVTANSGTAAAAGGGGILNFASLFIGNTIIAGNTAADQPEIRNLGAVISAGNNLVGDSANDATDTTNQITYQTAAGSADILDTPPMLGALADNGGATPTRALLTGSPAIDKGSNSLALSIQPGVALAADQRGAARIVDGDGNGTATVDIGAFEAPVAPTAAGASIGGRVQTADGRGIRHARVTMTDQNGETRFVVSGAFGNFHFADAAAGATYVFSVHAKRFQFAQPTQILTVTEDADNLVFVALGAKAEN